MRRFVPLAAAFAMTVAWSNAAWARDPAAAEALYRSGRDAAKKGDWDKACAQFAESQRLDPAPGTLINLADCEERRGLIASAWTHYVEASTQFKHGDSRIKFAKERAATLDKKVPRLIVKLEPNTPADAKVFRDDVELGTASLGVPLPVELGPHVVSVKLGGAEKRFPFNALEGSKNEILAGAPSASDPPPTASPTPSAPAPKHDASQDSRPPPPDAPDPPPDFRAMGWGLAGVGVVGIGVGTVTGLIALNKADEVKKTCGPEYLTCTNESVDAASGGKMLSTVSTVSFILGGALIVGGVYFILTSPSSSSQKKGATGGTTALGVSPTGLLVRGTF